MLRPLLTLPHPLLRQSAAPVTRFDPALRTLVRDMVETLRETGGVGLAAPQVGVMQRIVVIELPDDAGAALLRGQPLVLVNPQWVDTSENFEEEPERCLSVPDQGGWVPRHTRIVVQARNEWGKPHQHMLDGVAARALQHVVDHLDGVLFLDRVRGEDKRLPGGTQALMAPTDFKKGLSF